MLTALRELALLNINRRASSIHQRARLVGYASGGEDYIVANAYVCCLHCGFSDDNKKMTYSFRYDGTQSLTFTATFGGEVIEVKRTISVTAKESNWGTAKIRVGEADKGPSTQVVAGTQVTLVATANSGFTFDHWQFNGSNVSTASTFNVVMPDSDVSYMAVFRHSEAPDFYYGVFDTPTNNPVLDSITDDTGLTKGWLSDNAKAQITLPPRKTFVVLWRSSVVPTQCKITNDLSVDSLDFDNPQSFYATTKTLNNVAYTAREFYNGNTSSSKNWPVEITFAANSNSQE